MLVVGVLVAVMPVFNYLESHRPIVCINNMRMMESAANQFALEHHLTNGAAINFPNDLTPYFKDGKIPPCPFGGTYHFEKVGDKPTCSLGTTVTPAHVLP